MRRAGVEKLGYFPIPEPLIRWIAGQFAVPTGESITISDPCMGEGAALKILVDALRTSGAKVVPFGCEISRTRYATAIKHLLRFRACTSIRRSMSTAKSKIAGWN